MRIGCDGGMLLGKASLKKVAKILGKFPKRIMEKFVSISYRLRNYLSPLESDIYEIENILIVEDPSLSHLKRHLCIKNGFIVFSSSLCKNVLIKVRHTLFFAFFQKHTFANKKYWKGYTLTAKNI